MRRAVFALLLAVTAAGCGGSLEAEATVSDRPRAVASVSGDDSWALAGDAILHARVRGRTLEVRDGAKVVHRFEAPEGRISLAKLEASRDLAALIVSTEKRESGRRGEHLFAGPPAGPWGALAPSDYFPGWQQVDGPNLFVMEVREDYQDFRWVVREPGAEPRRLDLPKEAIMAVFTGDVVAYPLPERGQPEDDEPRRLVVRNWRTGEQRFTARIREGIEALDVRADGRVVLNEDGGGILEVRDGRVRRLTRSGVQPQYAGDRIVYVRHAGREGDERLKVLEPDGRVRAFGIPTAEVKGLVTDGERVLWSANGCLLVASVGGSAAREPGPGPCPRSELFLDRGEGAAMRPDGRVPLTLRCIAAAPSGCRGTVRVALMDPSPPGPDSTTVGFRIPAGRSQRLAPRLSARARRAAARDGAAVVKAVAVDPAGRRSVLEDGYWIGTR